LVKISSVRHFYVAAAAVAVAFVAPLSAHAQASGQLTLVINAPSGLASWNSVTGSTTAPVSYTLYEAPGLGVNPITGVGSTNQTVLLTSLPIGGLEGGRLVGSYCFEVTASDVVDGTFGYSNIVCHSYLHVSAGGNNAGYTVGDADGTLFGYGQTWNFGYWLDANATVTMQIFSPSTTFSTNAQGLQTPNGAAVPIQTVVGGVPRFGEGPGPTFPENTEIWDEGTSSGTKVPAGLYWVYLSVNDPSLGFVYGVAQDLAVVPIRFTAFNTSAITSSNLVSNINFTITANANVRTVIAQPGHQFTIDSSGNVQALSLAGVIDLSTNSTVQVITGQVPFNNPSTSFNTYTWNGTTSLGVAVSTGVYPVGMSATDSYGNQALNLAGNNGPLEGTIAVDRIPPATPPTGSAPQVSSISVNGVNLALSGGTNVGTFSNIVITLSGNAGPATTVTLVGPTGANLGGSVTEAGAVVTYSTTAVLSSTGSYTVTVNPFDTTGAYPGSQVVTQFNLPAVSGPSVTGLSIGGVPLTLAGGTTIAAPFSAVTVTLSAIAGSSTTVTLTGPLGPIAGGTLAGFGTTSVVYSTGVAISTAGAYSITVVPYNSTNVNLGPTDNTSFTASSTGGSSGGPSGIPQSPQQLSYSIVPYPNPAKTCATISFQTVAPESNVFVDIYTLAGARVTHQDISCSSGGTVTACPGSGLPGPTSPGYTNNCSYSWPLTNDQGGTVANGVYNVHITVNNSEGTVDAWKKVMVIK
jgi:hypothetical protein